MMALVKIFTEMKPRLLNEYSPGPNSKGNTVGSWQPPPSYGYTPAPPVLSQKSSTVSFLFYYLFYVIPFTSSVYLSEDVVIMHSWNIILCTPYTKML